MYSVKINKDSVPGLYVTDKSSVVVMPSTQQNGYVLLKGSARDKIVRTSSLSKNEYIFVKPYEKIQIEIQ